MTDRKPISKITGKKGEIMKLLDNVELAVLEDGTTFSSLKGSVVMVLTKEEYIRMINSTGDIREARAVITLDLDVLVREYLRGLAASIEKTEPKIADATVYVMDGGVVGVDCPGARVVVRDYDAGRNADDMRGDAPMSVGVFIDGEINKPFMEETYSDSTFSMAGYIPHPD